MRLREIKKVDIGAWQIFESCKHLNSLYVEQNKLFSNTPLNEELRDFLIGNKISITIGEIYYIAVVFWGPSDVKLINLSTSSTPFKVVSIEDNYINLMNTNTGKIKRFPDQAGPVLDKTQTTVFFYSEAEKSQWETLLRLKYSNWNIITNKL